MLCHWRQVCQRAYAARCAHIIFGRGEPIAEEPAREAVGIGELGPGTIVLGRDNRRWVSVMIYWGFQCLAGSPRAPVTVLPEMPSIATTTVCVSMHLYHLG